MNTSKNYIYDYSDFQDMTFQGWRNVQGDQRIWKHESNYYIAALSNPHFPGPYQIMDLFKDFDKPFKNTSPVTVKFKVAFSEGLDPRGFSVGLSGGDGSSVVVDYPPSDGKWHHREVSFTPTHANNNRLDFSVVGLATNALSAQVSFDEITVEQA